MVLHSCCDNGSLVVAWMWNKGVLQCSCCDNGFLVNPWPGCGTKVLQWCSTVVVTIMRGLDGEQRCFAMVLHSCCDNGVLQCVAWMWNKSCCDNCQCVAWYKAPRLGNKGVLQWCSTVAVTMSCCDNGSLVNAWPGCGTKVFYAVVVTMVFLSTHGLDVAQRCYNGTPQLL